MRKSRLLIVGILSSLFLMTACGGNKKDDATKVKMTKEELKSSIKIMEDSLKLLQSSKLPIENLHRMELVNRLLAFYRNYPEDKYAATCLDDVHMIYSGMGVHDLSITYADTLLAKYPKYANRAMILESQGSNYDIFSTPRDSAKVRYYYGLLLKENPNMNQEKQTGIRERLAHNDLTFDEYINKKIKEMDLK